MLSANRDQAKSLERPLKGAASRRRGLTRWLWAATAFAALAGSQPGREHPGRPRRPILLVVNSASANPYGPYLGEILKAEGLNSFSVAQLSTVTPTTLNSAQVVVLAETTLSPAQALTFSNYAAAGGRLIVMRPDAQLLPALGLSAEAVVDDRRLLRHQSGQQLRRRFPEHDAALPRAGAALHHRDRRSGSGHGLLKCRDGHPVPRGCQVPQHRHLDLRSRGSVVYTRQGFPANASDRDGQPPYRTTDIFYNAIDRDKVPIPYADVQMRMLARTINDLLADVMPLPRLWYFPGTNRTLVVLTADAHANPQSYYDARDQRGGELRRTNFHLRERRQSPQRRLRGGLAVATGTRWGCIRPGLRAASASRPHSRPT